MVMVMVTMSWKVRKVKIKHKRRLEHMGSEAEMQTKNEI